MARYLVLELLGMTLTMLQDRSKASPMYFLLAKCVVLITLPAEVTVLNSSYFPDGELNSRMSYYRWREWFLSHPVVLQNIPPVPKSTLIVSHDHLNVTVNMTPATVFKVDQAEQTIYLTAKIQLNWKDPALDVHRAGVVDDLTGGNASLLPAEIVIPSQSLWMPSIIIAEGISSLDVFSQGGRLSLSQAGMISFEIITVLSFTCQFDMSAYPYDEHVCNITFVDSSSLCSIVPTEEVFDGSVRDQFGVSGEWELVDFQSKRQPFIYGSYFTRFMLRLRRKTMFYTVIVVTPLVMTSYLNVLVFLLPPELGDKASYLVTVTISLSVFSSFFNEDMPRGLHTVPWIFYLYVFVLAEGFLTLLLTIFVVRQFRAEQEPQSHNADPRKGVVATSGSVLDHNLHHGRVSPMLPLTGPPGDAAAGSKWSSRRLDFWFFFAALFVNTIGIGVILGKMM